MSDVQLRPKGPAATRPPGASLGLALQNLQSVRQIGNEPRASLTDPAYRTFKKTQIKEGFKVTPKRSLASCRSLFPGFLASCLPSSFLLSYHFPALPLAILPVPPHGQRPKPSTVVLPK